MPVKGDVLKYCPKHPDVERVLLWDRYRCPICYKEKNKAANKKYMEKHPENRKHNHRVQSTKAYGLTPETKEAMWLKQNKRCAICGRDIELWGGPNVVAHIDHDHNTGEVRGLLCLHCNQGLGKFEDDAGRMMAAIKYLGGVPC